jgi:hypothetical protein
MSKVPEYMRDFMKELATDMERDFTRKLYGLPFPPPAERTKGEKIQAFANWEYQKYLIHCALHGCLTPPSAPRSDRTPPAPPEPEPRA